jgi:hypothetical protein
MFIGAVEAGERSWSPSSCVLQRAADIFSNDSDRGLGGLQGRDRRPVSVNSAELHLACSFVAWFLLLMCPPRLSTVDRLGSWSLSRVHVFVACRASWLCAVLLLALRMPLHTFVGWEAIVRA